MIEAGPSAFEVTRAALERLDARLRRAVTLAREAYGVGPDADPYRGLVVRDEEVDRLLTRAPGEPMLWSIDEEDGRQTLPSSHPARVLAERFGLSSFELDVVLLALAPEVDLRYERLYGWLHDDLNRRAPTISLALDLLCASAEERIDRLRCFDLDAPLRRYGILHLEAPTAPSKSGLARTIALDPAALRWLLGREPLDSRVGWARWMTPRFTLDDRDRLPLPAALLDEVAAWVAEPRLRLQVRGPHGSGRSLVAEALAGSRGRLLLVVDPRNAAPAEIAASLPGLALCAGLHDAVMMIRPGPGGIGFEPSAEHPASVVTLGDSSTSGVAEQARGRTLELSAVDEQGRRRWWAECLRRSPALVHRSVPPVVSETLGDRFRLDLHQIEAAVATADLRGSAGAEGEAEGPSLVAACMESARRVSSRELGRLATSIPAVRSWDDIVLPAETLAQLRELCERVEVRRRVVQAWGFGARLSAGLGCNALLAGPPGTGKTLAAEIVARALGLNLYRIDLAAVVSKYIGETEKNLGSIFDAAERSNAVLLFDEAESLFGKRSDVRDAHDRYANIEVAYLLQRMERYEGVAVLATNLSQHLDPAFTRRLAFTIHFPFPNPEHRRRIWQQIWPAAVPLHADVDLAWLAERFKLSGGHIKNAALAAAHLAAADGEVVRMAHLRHAVRREFQKLGKRLSDEELGVDPRTEAPVRIAGTG